jgi:hypothetical protein
MSINFTIMKQVFGFIALMFIFSACKEDNAYQPEDRELAYLLHQAGNAPVKGTVVFTELNEGKVRVDITLENTPEGFYFPAHLHFGGIGEVGELALQLNDVDGKTGRSTTVLDQQQEFLDMLFFHTAILV